MSNSLDSGRRPLQRSSPCDIDILHHLVPHPGDVDRNHAAIGSAERSASLSSIRTSSPSGLPDSQSSGVMPRVAAAVGLQAMHNSTIRGDDDRKETLRPVDYAWPFSNELSRGWRPALRLNQFGRRRDAPNRGGDPSV